MSSTEARSASRRTRSRIPTCCSSPMTTRGARSSSRNASSRSGSAAPIDSFCYPAGLFGPRERALVEEAGFATAVSCEPGVNTRRPTGSRSAARQIDRRDTMLDFRAKIAGGHDTPRACAASTGGALRRRRMTNVGRASAFVLAGKLGANLGYFAARPGARARARPVRPRCDRVLHDGRADGCRALRRRTARGGVGVHGARAGTRAPRSRATRCSPGRARGARGRGRMRHALRVPRPASRGAHPRPELLLLGGAIVAARCSTSVSRSRSACRSSACRRSLQLCTCGLRDRARGRLGGVGAHVRVGSGDLDRSASCSAAC